MKFKDLLNPRGDKYWLSKPYMLAEIGVNHEGDMQLARQLIDEAAWAGADGVKFQSYKAERLVIKSAKAYWDQTKEKTASQWELFKKYDGFEEKDYLELAKYCAEKKVEFFSTPFDLESLSFLKNIVPAIKISSSDLNNKPLVEAIAETGKPIILSTGASDLWEIQRMINWVEPYGSEIVILHCVLCYPTPDCEANLGAITTLTSAFPNNVIGYSDHTLPKDGSVLLTATLLGASIIEKHFTHDKSLPGNDHYHAMDKNDLLNFWERFEKMQDLCGSGNVACMKAEVKSQTMARRSIVAIRDISEGECFSQENLTFKRPGTGITVDNWDEIIGKQAARNILADEMISWSVVRDIGAI